MARILLNNLLGEIGKLLSLESSVTQEQNINFESTLVSGSQLATLINRRLQQRKQKNSNNLTPVLNENDLLPFSFFDAGKTAGKSICCLMRRFHKPEDLEKLINAAREPLLRVMLITFYGIDPIDDPNEFKDKAKNIDLPYASGFLIGGDYLLTNRHVVQEPDRLSEFRAVFKYEADFNQTESPIEILNKLDKYKFDSTFWVTSPNPELDYVLLKLEPLSDKSAGKQFNKVNLAKTIEGAVVPFVSKQILTTDSVLKANINSEFSDSIAKIEFISPDPIHMIQHPGGQPKQIVVFNNRLVNVYEHFLEYETDAQPGSSGSPLFNTDWQVVGIHQAAILDKDNENKAKIKGYLGIRIDSILQDLEAQRSTNSQVQDFLKNYIDERTTPPTKPPQVFILAGRNRNLVLGEENAQLEQKAMKNLRTSIITEIEGLALDVDSVPVSGYPENKNDVEALKQAIQYINKERNPEQSNELAIELLVNSSDNPKSQDVFCIKLYYNAGNDRAQKLALSLQTSLKKDNPSFFVSALPDSYTNTRGLWFCRNVNLPAVVIFLGDLANASDRKFLEKLQADPTHAASLTSSLTKGIFTALNVLKNR